MFKKIKTLHLALVFGVLLLVVFFVESSEETKSKGTFNKDLVNVEIDKVSAIKILTKAKNEVDLIKSDGSWQIKLGNSKFGKADDEKIVSAIDQIAIIKPSNLVSTDKEQYNEYQVDTSGVRVRVFEGDKLTLDIILGKFSYKSQREMYTYIRLTDAAEVYSVEGLLDITFNRQPEFWRYDVIIDSDPEDWTKLTYTYPGDSSFTLELKENGWFLDGIIQADSNKVIKKYFPRLKYLSNSNFADDVNSSSLRSPLMSLKIDVDGEEPIVINGYPSITDDSSFVITSSLNIDAAFTVKRSDAICKKLFPRKIRFIPGEIKVTDIQIGTS
ncbi:MAG: DUF4340 domain-containing protein [Bacteroidia bacterium]|nr:DUF4340 domain-containing protein [Bacteroidia bacterium]